MKITGQTPLYFGDREVIRLYVGAQRVGGDAVEEITATAPATMTSPTLTGGTESASLTLGPAPDDGGDAITGYSYEVTDSTDTGFAAPVAQGTQTPANLGTAIDISPLTAGDYIARQLATNSVGDGEWSPASAAETVEASVSTLVEPTSMWTGAVSEDSITVTAQVVTPDPVEIVVSQDETFQSGVVASTAITPDANYNLVRDKIVGLTPGASYHIATRMGNELSTLRGKFRTATPSGGFNFVLGSCHRTSEASNAISIFDPKMYDTIRGMDPDFFWHMGDIHYNDIAENDEAVFQAAFDEVFALPRTSEHHRSRPVFYIWDDHDYGPNNSDASSPSREASLAAYRSRVPNTDLAFTGALDPVCFTHDYQNVRFVALDLRSERSGNTFLGTAQEAWLMNIFETLPEDMFVCMVSSSPWIATNDGDTWSDASAQRTRIADKITATCPGRVWIIAGDMHALAYDDGTNSEGGIPVCHAAPLNQGDSFKGGPYTTPGIHFSTNQFGRLTITPGENSITARFEGFSCDESTGEATRRLDETFTLSSPVPTQTWDMSPDTESVTVNTSPSFSGVWDVDAGQTSITVNSSPQEVS